MGSFWKVVSRCWGWVAILFLWFLYGQAFDAVRLSDHWTFALLGTGRLILEPLVLVAVARRALTGQFWLLEEDGKGPFRTALRLYPRSLLICLAIVVLDLLLCRGLGLEAEMIYKGDLAQRLTHVLPRIPWSVLKILWLSVLVVRGRGILRSGVQGAVLFSRSRTVVQATVAWACALGLDVILPPVDLPAAVSAAGISRTLFVAAILTLGSFFAYTVVLREYRVLNGVMALPIPVGQALPLDDGTAKRDRTVSLWLVIFSFVPIVSIVALIFGRRAGLRLRWRSIRAVLAVSCGAFSTAAQALLLIGLLLSAWRGPGGDDYAFLAQADPSAREETELLKAGRLADIAERFTTPEATAKTWGQFAALGIAQKGMGETEQALLSFEKASKLGPNRGEFFELYGNLLLREGRSTEAANQLRRAGKQGLKRQSVENLLALTRRAYKPSKTVSIIWSIGILIVLFTVHEYAHAWAAFKLGDDTAANEGRLTFNPIAHLDVVGSLLLPGIMLWRESDVLFGWAKPVPVNPEKFADPKHDHMLVSFAGPAANLLMSFVGVLLFFASLVVIRLWFPDALSVDLGNPMTEVAIAGGSLPYAVAPILSFLKQLMVTSLILACFNLLPVPPLDGSWILSGLLPPRLHGVLEGVRRYGFIIFLVLVFTSALDYLLVVPLLFMWVGTIAGCALLGFQ